MSSRGDIDEAELAENLSRGFLFPPKLLHATWVPVPTGNGTGNEPVSAPAPIIFVENFTVYFIPDVGAKAKKVYPISQVDQVVPEVVINGIPDWIYEGNVCLCHTKCLNRVKCSEL